MESSDSDAQSNVATGGLTGGVRRWLLVAMAALIGMGCLVRKANADESSDRPAGLNASTESGQPWSVLNHLPRDAYFVAGVRPRSLLRSTGFEDIDRLLASLTENALGRRLDVVPSEIEQFAAVGTYGGARLADYNTMVVVELQSHNAARRLMKSLFGTEFDEDSLERSSLSAVITLRQLAGVLLADRTVLLGQPAVLQNWDFSGQAKANAQAVVPWPVESAAAETTHAFAVFDVVRLRRFAPRFDDWMLSEHPMLAAASPLLRETRRLEVVSDGHNGLRATAAIVASEEALSDIEATLRAGATILRNVLNEESSKLPAWSRDVAVPTFSLLRDGLKSPNVEADALAGSVRLTVEISRRQLEAFHAVLRPMADEVEVSARRALRSRNLQRIVTAAIDYYEVHRHLPMPVATDGDSGVKHSWRVTLLPFLGEQALYDRYRLDEPWDSDTNRELLRRMPDVYRHVDDSPTSFRTAYYGLVGPETAFGDGSEPIRLRDIRDGISNTILVVESRQEIPWTMPSDLEFVPGRPLPSFGGFDPAGALVGRVDALVSFLPESVSEDSRRAFVTRAGGERISLP
jgi:hypothetical protein